MPIDTSNSLAEPEMFFCSNCGDGYEDSDAADNCCTSFECSHCGSEYPDEWDADHCCHYECSVCGSDYRTDYEAQECCSSPGSADFTAVAEAQNTPADYFVQIASLPGRAARLISVEQEISEGAGSVCSLFGQGDLYSYSDSGRRGDAIIKEDGSLGSDGGEILYSRFDLSETGHATTFSILTAKIAKLRSERAVRLDSDAGVHIHVSARDLDGVAFTPKAMASLYEMFEWSAPLLYPLASLGWRSHRGTSFCRKPDKIRDISPGKVPHAVSGERYLGLNYQRLLSAVNRCHCGACDCGDWQACTCGVLEDATIEWRLFNATTSPKTLHTYLIVALSMTAEAMRHDIGSLPDNPDLSEIREWLLSCPMSYSERALLAEQISHAPGLAHIT